MLNINGKAGETMLDKTNLSLRLNYYGGEKQQSRMIQDKARDLRKALLYSYQADTAVLEDGREFRCLINPNEDEVETDKKILAIPFKDICLNKEKVEKNKTSQDFETIGIKEGDTFTWKETNTHWLVFNQYIQEKAYFRAEIYLCQDEIDINGQHFWVYMSRKRPEDLKWLKNSNSILNEYGYSNVLYIKRNDITLKFFQRFKHFKIGNQYWQVVSVQEQYGLGLIQVFIKETYSNDLENNLEQTPEEPTIPEGNNKPYIEGKTTASLFSEENYKIHNLNNGQWFLQYEGQPLIDLQNNSNSVNILIQNKKTFFVIYKTKDTEIKLQVKVSSF